MNQHTLEGEPNREVLTGCDFCEIGEDRLFHIPVVKRDKAIAIMSKRDGRVLIIPKVHALSLGDSRYEEEINETFRLAKDLFEPGKWVFRDIGASSFKMWVNDGQRPHMEHLHFNLGGFLDSSFQNPFVITEEARPEVAERINAALQDMC